MTTATDRLQQLSGLAGVSAAAMLLAIGHGATTGAALVAYSGLPTGSAAQHLLAVVTQVQPAPSIRAGSGRVGGRRWSEDVPRRSDDDDVLILVLL